MKLIAALCILVATCFAEQPFSHVVILIQENRTPDNLFADCGLSQIDAPQKGPMISLGSTINPSHRHAEFVTENKGKWPVSYSAYVQASDIEPYCQLAASYGFGNRMFQTNQGSSTAAHLFLFAGTSQPENGSPLFEAEVVSGGCIDNLEAIFINPEGQEGKWGTGCLDPSTLADLLDAKGLSWRYYVPGATSMWNAPVAIQHICQPEDKHCTGPDWKNKVSVSPPQFLTDIQNGKLADVSWVNPAASYSDHPLYGTGGPNWVASIVNAIGNSSYWENTAVIVTWDDWGGWYDHVAPLSNETGFCESYCYGFRVPLLFISAYTQPGYSDYVDRDFGSVVKWVENIFSLPSLGVADFYAPNDLSGFVNLTEPRSFNTIQARPMTPSEMADTDAGDDD